jgi:uncharacterized protein YceH (UPF0502 family)
MLERLNEVEVRILGALMEKQRTTPDYYPMTLNSLTAACNQTSNRDPVVNYDEMTIVQGLDSLRGKRLAWNEATEARPEPATLAVRRDEERFSALEAQVVELRQQLASLREDFDDLRRQLE